jgi:hypothetical protein
MRLLAAVLALLASAVLASEPAQRPSARLVLAGPEALQPGRCVVYREGGDGLLITEPSYYVQGRVVAATVQARPLAACPEVPGKGVEQYSRAEFTRLLHAQPCLAGDTSGREALVGVVALRVDEWDTPHARRAANAGRLYRGMFIDRELQKGMEIELEADLLGACAP